LLVIAAVYFVAMVTIGKLARTGGLLDGRLNFRAGSHGAAGFCIVAIFAGSGILTLQEQWSSSFAWGLSLLTVSASCALGMVVFGRIGCGSANDAS
jgi:hypothetical protein